MSFLVILVNLSYAYSDDAKNCQEKKESAENISFEKEITKLSKDITLKSNIQKILNAPIALEGPNCFNTALLTNGIVENIRFVSTLEFEYYLKNNCTPLKDISEMQAGDIVVEIDLPEIDFVNGATFHAFVYLSDDKAIGKLSRSVRDQPKIEAFEEAFSYSKVSHLLTQYTEAEKEIVDIPARPFRCRGESNIPDDIKKLFKEFEEANIAKVPVSSHQITSWKKRVLKMKTDLTLDKNLDQKFREGIIYSMVYQVYLYEKNFFNKSWKEMGSIGDYL